jgi:hypothetical protein
MTVATLDLIVYWLFNHHGTVSPKQIAEGEQDMIQVCVVCLCNIVCNGKRLENELQAITHCQSLYSLSWSNLMLTSANPEATGQPVQTGIGSQKPQ